MILLKGVMICQYLIAFVPEAAKIARINGDAFITVIPLVGFFKLLMRKKKLRHFVNKCFTPDLFLLVEKKMKIFKNMFIQKNTT